MRAGRQELVFGEQRLVGHLSWVNTARTFDGAKATFRTKAFSVDVFAASVVRILDDEFDKSGNGNRFAGAYATTAKLIPQATVEPYVFCRATSTCAARPARSATLQQTTVGVRIAGKLPARLDYGIEMALQRGSLGTDDVSAWAGHWQLRESLPGRGAVEADRRIQLRVRRRGSRPTASAARSISSIRPPHDKYGLADQVGWQNIHHLRAGFEFTPFKATADHRRTITRGGWPKSATRLYSAGSAVARARARRRRRPPRRPGDRRPGRRARSTPQLQLAAGYAHIFTGAFLKQATPGASYSHPYVMVTYVFLAER